MWVILLFGCLISSTVCDLYDLEDDLTDSAVSSETDGDKEALSKDLMRLSQNANEAPSSDEEYEDLKAELFAYRTALDSLTADASYRKSLQSTPCWQLGGICIDFKLCSAHHYLTQVPGCRNKLQVCCFEWNKFRIRDFVNEGIEPMGMPWRSHSVPFGGKGVFFKGEPN